MRLFDPPVLPASIGGTAITVGTFDGVHVGHQDVLARLVQMSRRAGLPSLLVTFEPHPLEVLKPEEAPLLLTTRAEKLAALGETGLDHLAIIPFTPALAALSAEEFVDRVLLDTFRVRALMIGHDHGFGRGRQGDVETLRSLGATRGFDVEVVPPVRTPAGVPVSSSLVRRAIAAGDLRTAGEALGREYSVSGAVVPGEGRGRTLGFRTLNLELESTRKLLPPDGVYAVDVWTSRGRFGGMMNLGGRPTFGDDRRTLEAHLFDVDGDFYGEVVRVGFAERIRDVMRFDGPAALMTQLADDERRARRALTALGIAGNLNGSTPVPPSTP